MTAAAMVVAVLVTSVVLTAVIVAVLGDVVAHLRGARGLPTCRRAVGDLAGVARVVARRSRRRASGEKVAQEP